MKHTTDSRSRLSLRGLARWRLAQIAAEEASGQGSSGLGSSGLGSSGLGSSGQGTSVRGWLAGWLASGALIPGLLTLVACTDELGPQPVLPIETKTGELTEGRPLETGILSVSPDGAFAVASDAIGERVYVITLSADALSARPVELAPGDAPGRSASSATHAYVALPDTGGLAVIDLASASLVDRFTPCPSPQGVAVDGDSLHVACRGGELVTLSLVDGAVERALMLDEDLRDVVVHGTGMVVSRFASAELLWLDAEGTLLHRTTPEVGDGSQAAVAWRTVLGPDGAVLVAHQTDSDQDLGSSYSGGNCGSITAPTVTIFSPPGMQVGGAIEAMDLAQQVNQMSMIGGAGTFDLTVAGPELILVFPGNEFARQFADLPPSTDSDPFADDGNIEFRSIHRFQLASEMFTCSIGANRCQDDADVPLSIVTAPAGPLSGQALVLTQSPAGVKVLDSALSVRLHDERRASEGLALFQMSVGAGVACASCHPGGRADARTWRLARGPRRTQPLEGGVSQLGAFHWDAEFLEFDDLIDDVMTGRMGLAQELSAQSKTQLLAFLDGIPKSALPAPAQDSEAAARGRAIFESPEAACSHCHSGPRLTNNSAYDVGTGGIFVTPSLEGVGYREPLMHDGCASNLEERFGPCGGGDKHGLTSQLTDADVSDLVAFMRTL